MKLAFKPGAKKHHKKIVTEADLASFQGEALHPVCATFALARDFEWSSRQFFLEMKEENEEGVGTFLSIDHVGPAFVGEEITFAATVLKIRGNELTCTIEAKVGARTIATGTTGQKMLTKDKLNSIFKK